MYLFSKEEEENKRPTKKEQKGEWHDNSSKQNENGMATFFSST